MIAGTTRVPPPANEPNLAYLPGSPERAELKARLEAMAGERVDIPVVIDGREIRTGRTHQAVMPHNHQHVLADWHMAEPKHVQMAIKAAMAARREWSSWAFEDRAAILLKAADLLAPTLGEARAQDVITMVRDLELLPDVAMLTRLLRTNT